jgi:hypothetical protein
MRQETINIYTYDELSEEVKKRVIKEFHNLNVDHDWWDSIYEDAEEIGLKIIAFNCTTSYINTKPLTAEDNIAQAIIETHGKGCKTFQLAVEYLKEVKEIESRKDLDEDAEAERLQEVADQFIHDLSHKYLLSLKYEYKYLISRKAIEEGIIANGYEFTKYGKPWF